MGARKGSPNSITMSDVTVTDFEDAPLNDARPSSGGKKKRVTNIRLFLPKVDQ